MEPCLHPKEAEKKVGVMTHVPKIWKKTLDFFKYETCLKNFEQKPEIRVFLLQIPLSYVFALCELDTCEYLS